MTIDQQGLGWPMPGEQMIDQQLAGCQEKPSQSEDAKLKAKLKMRTQLFQHADQICTAALIFISPIWQPSQGSATSKEIPKQPHTL